MKLLTSYRVYGIWRGYVYHSRGTTSGSSSPQVDLLRGILLSDRRRIEGLLQPGESCATSTERPSSGSDEDGLPNAVEYTFDLDPSALSVLPYVWENLDRDRPNVVIAPMSRDTSLLEVSQDLTEGSWQSVTAPVALSAVTSMSLVLSDFITDRQGYVRVRIDL